MHEGANQKSYISEYNTGDTTFRKKSVSQKYIYAFTRKSNFVQCKLATINRQGKWTLDNNYKILLNLICTVQVAEINRQGKWTTILKYF